jgi:hypothetical protein
MDSEELIKIGFDEQQRLYTTKALSDLMEMALLKGDWGRRHCLESLQAFMYVIISNSESLKLANDILPIESSVHTGLLPAGPRVTTHCWEALSRFGLTKLFRGRATLNQLL